MSRVEAVVLRDGRDWQRNTVTLMVRQQRGAAAFDYLMADGTWKEAQEGAGIPDAGLILPADAVEALAIAIREYQGHTSHADTEARVLREWLAVEQRRVDTALGR